VRIVATSSAATSRPRSSMNPTWTGRLFLRVLRSVVGPSGRGRWAKQHLEAAKQHVEGEFEKAAHHAQLAHAHHVEAFEHARNAAKEHLKAHGK
jgi:hypothetical protein